MGFQECLPLQYNLFFKLTQSDTFGVVETWPNLISTSEDEDHNLSVFYKGENNSICQIFLEKQCFVFKKTYKILYAKSHEITTIKLVKGLKKKDVNYLYILLGFDDGSVDINELSTTKTSLGISNNNHIEFQGSNKPVVNLAFENGKLYICFVDGFSVIDDFSLQKTTKNGEKLKVKRHSLPDKNKHNMKVGKKNQVYVYNQINGLVRFTQPQLQSQLRIQDCLKVMHEISSKDGETLVLGCSDGSLKFISYRDQTIYRFLGFKNFVSDIFQDQENNLIWVGCLDGTITCFCYKQNHNKKQQNDKNFEYKIQKVRTPRTCLVQNGISNIFVHDKILIVKDIQHNIYFYDLTDGGQTSQRTNLRSQN